MTTMRCAAIFVLVNAAIGCSGVAHESLAQRNAEQRETAIREEVAASYEGYSETITVAEKAGYDYLGTVSGCLMRTEQAMHKLFEMTEKAGFDAAASEGHSEVLGFVLRDVGDRFFGGCLSAEPSAVQQAVRRELLFDLGYDGDYEDKGELVHQLYSKTFPDARKL